MKLPIPTDFPPMEADMAREIPTGAEWQYEPKWDGFRCLAFRDGDEIELISKSSQPLARYFPEVTTALLALGAKQFVLDGELIVTEKRSLDFDALLQRIHPAASRIKKLSVETPATFMLFDLLIDDKGDNWTSHPLHERRKALESFAREFTVDNLRVRLSPYTCEFETAKGWFERMAGPLDGVVAKRTNLPYDAGARRSMLKIKNLRTADCVVGGFRYGTGAETVGSLLLGLYGEDGLLHHVGFTSGLARDKKAQLTEQLKQLIEEPGFSGAKPGGPSRWSTERSTEWKPLAPRLVVEVQYDHFSGGRFRHGTKILRWRPDKRPDQCTMRQVEHDTDSPLSLLD